MKRDWFISVVLSLTLSVIVAQAPVATAAEIKVFTAWAGVAVFEKIGPQFERTTGHKLNIISGFGPIFAKQIKAGESFDILISTPPTIDGLIKDGRIMAAPTILFRAGNGVEVRAGAPKPDISSVEAFKRTLLGAKSVGYLGVGGVPAMIERLGIADHIKPKATIPSDDIVSELVAKGELDLGIVPITQILTKPGVELVGSLPPEIQFYSVFAAGISAHSTAPEAAAELIKFIRGPSAFSAIKAVGMEPGFISDLAPTGKLRIALWALNSNFLSKNPATGELTGLWPELARELASRLGVPYTIVPTQSIIGPYAVLKDKEADMAFTEKAIGVDDPHADAVDFTPPYVHVPITILVRASSSIRELSDINQPGIRVATPKDGPADVILTRDYRQLEVVRTTGGVYYDLVRDRKADAAAGPISGELNYIGSSSDYRILSNPLFMNTQLIALPKGRAEALAYLRMFVEDVKASGVIQRLLDRSGKKGIKVAPVEP